MDTNTRLYQTLRLLGRKLSRSLWSERRVWGTAIAVTTGVVVLRWIGILQPMELTALDQLFRWRPVEPMDERILIVGIDDADINRLQTWPIPDAVMAELISFLKAREPRVIGLDIYREVPVEPGQSELQEIFATTPNLIGIEKVGDAESSGVMPPPILDELGQVGFNNVVVDMDGTVRRMLLFWRVDQETHQSFSLQLALRYLEAEGILPTASSENPDYLQLEQETFVRLQSNSGSYVRIDAGGYQVLANPRGPASHFRRVSLQDVLAGRVPEEWIRDRIVLIGSTADSLRDYFYTAYSRDLNGNVQPITGVELHANFVSQILSAAMNQRSLLRVMPEGFELFWIWLWACLGAGMAWKVRSPLRLALGLFVAIGSGVGIAFLLFLQSVWIPLVPPMLALVTSNIAIISYLAHQEEELQKSKEFLYSIINTIPDPVFVKDRNHRWIVLNNAYCRFIGYPMRALLDRSDFDFFPTDQATYFWQQDDITFQTGVEQEQEESFTNAQGVTYVIATKRSLHRDAAGNLFLVGVIRDITRRKQVETDLRRTAEELVRSNAELRKAEGRLRHMAYYDTLTGLPNRDLLQERLTEALDKAKLHSQLVAVLFLDLDGFKQINDTYGHLVGNLVLQSVAQRLLGCLRSSDTVARLGGDEFVVLLPAIPCLQDIQRVAEKILLTLSEKFSLEGYNVPISTSIGISIYPHDATEMDVLIKLADTAMYRAKDLGKNCYQFYGDS